MSLLNTLNTLNRLSLLAVFMVCTAPLLAQGQEDFTPSLIEIVKDV